MALAHMRQAIPRQRRMTMGQHGYLQDWYLLNVRMLQKLFGRVSFDDIAFRWVKIHDFPLPDIFQAEQSSLLITTPGANIENHHAYGFYLDTHLSRKDSKTTRYLFEDDSYNDLFNKGYSKLCFNLKGFRPSYPAINGDTLVDLCQSIYNFLAQKSGI
jgi:hypothetical protein